MKQRESTEEDGDEKSDSEFVNPISEVVKEWVNKRQNYNNDQRAHHRGPKAEDILDASDIEEA